MDGRSKSPAPSALKKEKDAAKPPEVSSRPRSSGGQARSDDMQNAILWRESQRISLRAFLRALLGNPQVAATKAMQEFLTLEAITPTDEDVEDIVRRKAVDKKRMEEQKEFYDIARKRAAELDVYMEQYVRDAVDGWFAQR